MEHQLNHLFKVNLNKFIRTFEEDGKDTTAMEDLKTQFAALKLAEINSVIKTRAMLESTLQDLRGHKRTRGDAERLLDYMSSYPEEDARNLLKYFMEREDELYKDEFYKDNKE